MRTWICGLVSFFLAASAGAAANVSIDKSSDASGPVSRSATVVYTLEVEADSLGDDATDVEVVDDLPAGVTYSSNDCSASHSAGRVTWDIGDLDAGDAVSCDITVTVDADASGTITNTATVTATEDPSSDSSSAAFDVREADLSVVKSRAGGAAEVVPGETVTYVLTVSNAGPDDVTAADVFDTFDSTILDLSGSSFWTCSADTSSSCPASGSAADLAAGVKVDIAAGESVVFTTDAIPVDPSATGTLSNTAYVVADDVYDPSGASTAVGDPCPTDGSDNNCDVDDAALQPRANLAVTVDDGVTSVVPGKDLTVTVTVSNAGPSDAPGSQVSADLLYDLIGISWTCATPGGTTATCSASG
ncbi:MAG: hypothetical protein SX243_11925, partial [Acidobacteriota bacterium]|nr:hypothetical protein [Acidobacteriota bacterium]